ncbi:CTP synthase [Candidatus Nanohalobium constans]|uniref:CTP synthase (glutamine hydrolyzing) n=1 Tax=Candidatus Nanohalobium constans TaxID=2565781 RepID=A0A5Q0UFI6_9ARCH|nr:CTP synthase [Candidatus Nanohalobium constans]QGA80347.1 CTP synthase [Candidatus Nanohalobium constans]
MPKWIFVTGGVLSGLGKGLVSASVSKLLQLRDQDMMPVKCDGYLNIDPGTMNPHEHGEVFVLEDGTEVDMDFGHYERFLGVKGKGDWNLTSGKIFQEVIDKERNGDYLGKTVQMVPHVTDQIRDKWENSAQEEDADIVIVEVGGTVGDIENMLYLETIRQMRSELPEEDTFLIHTTLVPYLETTGEQKTKPTQHSVKDLREEGLSPDMIVGRSQEKLTEEVQEKISLFCDVEKEAVISDPNLESVYELPLLFEDQGVDEIISRKMKLQTRNKDMQDWKKRVKALRNGEIAMIGICGKYMDMEDSYASVEEALKHAAVEEGGKIGIEYIDTENFDPEKLEELDGVVIPGGFGSRGVQGKIEAIKHCRENDIPVLGLCYGLQLMVVEFARNKLDIDAASAEFGDEDQEYVVKHMPDQEGIDQKGGTMRLGSYKAELTGQVKEIYGSEMASERHRHRYEVNPEYHQKLEQNGLKISGKTGNGELAEYVEIPEHSFFIGTQAHPEFNSTFEEPNPLYHAFTKTAQNQTP